MDRKIRIAELVRRANRQDKQEDAEEAARELRQEAAAWRGFPGQRRRGEPPAGVAIR